MKKTFLFLTLLVGISTIVSSCGNNAEANVEYYCPMHPEIVSDEPGNCPKCNMKLEKREKGSAADTTKS